MQESINKEPARNETIDSLGLIALAQIPKKVQPSKLGSGVFVSDLSNAADQSIEYFGAVMADKEIRIVSFDVSLKSSKHCQLVVAFDELIAIGMISQSLQVVSPMPEFGAWVFDLYFVIIANVVTDRIYVGFIFPIGGEVFLGAYTSRDYRFDRKAHHPHSGRIFHRIADFD